MLVASVDVGFCDAEITDFPPFSYFWPEVEAGITASLPCELGPTVLNGMARRTCNPDTAEWEPVSLDECFTSEPLSYNFYHTVYMIMKFVM